MKILIIEDEVLIQQSLKILMENMGLSVDVTAQGREAIMMLQKTNYDKIICDLMLQDITGFDVIEESLKRYSRDEIKNKFVIMSAYNSTEILEKAASYQCLFISKPFQHIKETLKMMLA